MGTGRAISRVLVVLAAGALTLLPAAASAAPAERATGSSPKAGATPVPRIVTRSIRCAATASSTRKLTAAQRAQVRRYGAFKAKRKVGKRTQVVWICVRTAKQAKAVTTLTRGLGTPTTDLQALVVSFPKTLDGRLDIDLPGGDRASWVLQGAPKVPAQSYQHGAVYSTTEYDVVQDVDWGKLKESIVVHRAQGTRTWSWKLSWKGGKAPYVSADGTVRYGSDVVIAKPFLQNAAGTRIRDLSWKLDGDVLSVTFDDTGLALPYVLDPASSYPQWLYPSPAYVPGSATVNGLFATPGAVDTGDQVLDIDDAVGSEYMFWSNSTSNAIQPGGVTNATHPLPMDNNPPTSNATGYGAYGWAQESLGGVTLPLGPYSAAARVQVSSASGANPVSIAVKARLWKGRAAPSDANFVQLEDAPAPVAITSWVTSAPQVYNGNNQVRDFTIPNMTVNPGTNILGVSDHVFLEYALVLLDPGPNNSNAILHTRSANTYIDFGAATTNTPGTADNLRLSAPTGVATGGWTNDNTPRLRADLDDPDWYHHIDYEVCTAAFTPAQTCAAAGGTLSASGSSTFGQVAGGGTNDWTTPALADGTYHMRARTREDDTVANGDDQVGAWNNFTGTYCNAPDVGACGRFRIDTVLPNGAITSPATGSWNGGTVTVSGTASDAASGVATHSLQWRRITPSAAGPSSTGITCSGASSPTWSCSWNTTAVIDGDYELQLTVTDVAGNSRLVTSSTYRVDNTAPAWPGGSFWRDSAGPGDVTYINTLTTLASNWSAATDANSISRYEYCYSTSPSGADCGAGATKAWTSNLLALTNTSSGLTLTEGGAYYSCVRAFDPAGNASTVQCSNGQIVDTLLPTLPTVNDGSAADITWINQTNTPANTIQGNWTGGGDSGSGVNRWEYCVTTSSTGADCAGAPLRTWTSTALLTSMSAAPIATTEGTQYFVCVRVFDNAGNASSGHQCSNGQRKDTVVAGNPGVPLDGLGPDINVQSNTTTLNANWGASTDATSGVARYQYCITTTLGGGNCAAGAMVTWTDNAPLTGTTLTRSGLTLVDGSTYYVCVRAQDVAANPFTGTFCSNGVLIDGVPPAWPVGASRDGVGPVTDVVWTTSTTSLSSHWSAATDANGIGLYEYCLSTSMTGADCAGAPTKGWTSNGTTLTETSGGLSLAHGTTYYSCVRATDNAGNTGAVLCSNGQTVDAVAPVLPGAVTDGPGPGDLTWLLSLTTSQALMSGGSDPLSGVNRWEYCVSTAASCAGTVVRNWTSNGTSFNITSAGMTLVEGEQYVTCVRGFDNAGNMTAGTTCSNGQRVDTVAPTASAGVNDGSGADVDFTSSTTNLNANWSTVTDPTPGVGSASGLQKYQYCVTTNATGADCAGGAMIIWTDNAPLTASSIALTGLSLTNGSTYRVCVRGVDVATNAGTRTCSDGITVDVGPPVASWTSWTEPVGSESAYLFSPGGNLLWFNPSPSGTDPGVARATVTATDPGAGMDRVDFPNLGAGAAWGAGGSDNTVGPANTWTWDYSFTGTGAIGDPAINNATAYDTGGASTGAPALNFDIRPDSTPPTVVSPMATAMSGRQNTVTLNQSVPLGTDADSGVGRWIMDVRYAPLTDDACGSWDPWVDGSTITGYSGPATNGTTLNITHYLNDPDFNNVANYYDAFCFQTRVRVFDNVDNMSTIAENGFTKFDFGVPDVAFTAPPNGSAQSGTFNITGTTDDVWPGGGVEYPNTGSGIASVVVTWESPDGPDAGTAPDLTGTACTIPNASLTGPWTGHGWTCSWNSATPAMDGIYTIKVQATDRAGNVSTIQSRTYLIDNVAPVRAFHSWNDNGSAWMHSVGATAWVNPTAPAGAYQLDARVTATDAGSNVNRVEFPGLGLGWTPSAGLTNATFTSPVPVANAYTMSYTFANPGTLLAPGAQNATAFDNAGNSGTIPFTVRLDGAAPTGMTAAVVNGNQTSATVAVTLGAGTEGATESGLGSWQLFVDTAPLTNDSCGAWANTWTSVTSGLGAAPATYNHDVTALGSNCYRYRLDVTDNVGNVGQSTPGTARRVDLVLPSVAITAPATGSVQGGTFAVSGTASDVHTGINKVRLTWTGPEAPGSGVICDPATMGGAYNAYTFTCNWNTSTFDDGTYTVTATSYDVAGNVSAVSTISVLLDNFPPFVGFHSYVETSQYTYWAGPVGTNNQLWYNPNAPSASYSFQVLISATDPSGINRVEYDSAGAGWTGGMPATQTVPVGPADRYSQTYSFNTAGAVADPPTLNAKAFDATAVNNASVPFEFTPDTALPATGSVTNTNGYNPSTTVVATIASGNDGAGSGIQGWTLLRDTATLSAGTCVGWTGYTTTVASGTGTVTGTRNDTVADASCARYRLLVTDNVGNVGTFTGTDVTRIDLTPPTGSVTVAENTGTQWTYLANPTRLFVNTSAGTSGTFDVNVNATAASGVLDVTFPPLAAGFTNNGVMPGPGPNFTRTYSWTGVAGTPAVPVNAAVRSNSLGSLNLPFEIVADAAGPTGATVSHASGFTTSTSLVVTYTAGTDGTGSGIAGHQLEREAGTLAAGACTWSGSWLPAGPAGGASYTDPALAHAGCYRYRVAVTDNVGNVGYSPVSTARMVDTTAPTGATITLAEGTNPAEQWVSATDTIWVKAAPTGPANFAVTVTATDPESGTGAAVFPALGSTFVFTPGGAYTGTYAWSPTAVAPGVAPSVQVANGSGLTTTIPFTVNVDGAAPTGATLDQENGLITDFMVDLAYTTGGDGAGSGVATWRIERQDAPYTIATNTCGTWTPWTVYPSAPGHPASPYVDTGVVQPTCYRYRLVEIDQVGNVTNTVDPAGDIAKVIFDITPPTAFNLNLPTNPALPAITTGQPAPACGSVPTYTTATPAFSWTASTDAESGLQKYDVYVDGIGSVDGSVPAPGTTWTSPALSEGAHTLGVRALDYQANFRNANPAFPANIQVDTSAPTGSLTAPAMGSWSGDTTPTLDWAATDATCLARIEVFLDGSGTAAAVASGTEGSWTPAAPLADGAHTWTFRATDVAGNSATFGPYSFGIDTTPPTAFALTAPIAGQTVRGFVNVTWTASADLESGLAPAAAYQVWVDGVLRGTLAAGTTSTSISGITNGGHTIFVRALDLVGNTRDTAPVLFTGYGAIPPPVLISPADTAPLNTVPSLDWNWPSDGGPAPTSYDVVLDGATVGSVAHPTSILAIADPGDGNHTWRIVQHDPYTGTVTSGTRSFILDRTLPINAGPLNRAATVVSWPAPVDPAAPVASGIDYQEFWIDPAGPAVPTSTTLLAASTSRDYGTLPDGVYTMWVRAYDRAGNFTDSPSISVTNDSVPPTAFNLTAPAALPGLPAITNGPAAPSCETDPTYVSATPTLAWSASSDATSGLAGYDVYVDGAMVTSVGPGVTSHTLAAPLTGGTHTWRVVARDNFGLTRTSTPSPMNVRVDVNAPTISFSAPADNSYTNDTTPAFTWAAGDDNCLARIEITIGGNVYVLTGGTTGFTSPVALPEGPTTWSLRAFDSAGRVTSAGAPRTINVDTTAPTGLTATFPANGSTVPEGMLTFSWSTGTDAGSGVDHYDFILNGVPVASGLTATSNGTHAILGPPNMGDPATPHNWAIRVYDAVGNSQLYPFTFSASYVADITPPSPFNLLTPANGASIPAGTALTWEPAWDFKGVTQYRVYIDGALAATTAGNVTTYTPAAGAGAPICSVTFDPATSAGCLTGPSFSSGASPGSISGPTGGAWNTTTAAGWASAGNAYGIGDQSLPANNVNSGFDGDRVWTAVEYQTSIPAAGGDIRVEHRYNLHKIGDNPYDGATIELKIDDLGNGFGDDPWETTCEFNAFAIYGASLRCDHEVIENAGGPNVIMGGANASAHPIYHQNAFSGNSGGIVQTKLQMSEFAGKNVQIRFRIGTDSCFTGISGVDPDRAAVCDDTELGMGAPGYFPAQWRIDNVTLANTSLLPGPHTWYVEARDAAGNTRQSTQTWTFNLL